MKILTLLYLLFLIPAWSAGQNRYDIIIDEIMADPTPQVALPNNEWIELKNVSNQAINLQNWRIGDASGQSGPLPSLLLQPDSFIIICTGSALAAMSAFGKAISVTSFPSLDNDGDQLFLKSADGRIIHAVNYSSGWYRNELKKEGGWTLEMIDTHNPCSGYSNWIASHHPDGGTPGKKNSADAINRDEAGPVLRKAYPIDPLTIILELDEPVDSLHAAMAANYNIDGGPAITNTVCIAPLFDKVQLKINSPLLPGIIYTISATNLIDCSNNSIGNTNKIKFGLATVALAGDIIINEILFNPRSGGYDFVEFYNRGEKILDASKLYIANRSSSGMVSNLKPLSASPLLIFPGDYIVVTENETSLASSYFIKNPQWVLQVSSLPSFPDDKGYVLLLNDQGIIIDEVDYFKDWHFKLIDNNEGVSLERIDPDSPSNEAANWHSAASTGGYATPTAKNSQSRSSASIAATLQVLPKIFSPDNDGRDDIATIFYQLPEPGYIANITIFDAGGRPVKRLVRNGTMGLQGYWNWDGLDDEGKKLPVGIYIIFTEMFNLQGKKSAFKNAIVLARKLD